jgi:cell division protein FtsX
MSYWSREIGGRFWSRLSLTLQLALSLAPVAVMLLVTENLQRYETDLRAKLRYVVYLNDQTTPDDLQALIARAKALDGFASFAYRDKSEVFREMQDLVGAELLPGQSTNPFPHLLELRFHSRWATLAHFERATIALKKFPTIEEINYGAGWLAIQERAFAASRQIAMILRLITMAAAALLVYWQTRRLLQSHQPFLHSLRLLGAGWRQLSLPILNRMIGDAAFAALVCLGALYLACVIAGRWELQLSYFSLPGIAAVIFLTVATAFIGTAVALRGVRG